VTPAAVLFDLDGTLVDTLPVCYLAFRRTLELAGAPAMTTVDLPDSGSTRVCGAT